MKPGCTSDPLLALVEARMRDVRRNHQGQSVSSAQLSKAYKVATGALLDLSSALGRSGRRDLSGVVDRMVSDIRNGQKSMT